MNSAPNYSLHSRPPRTAFTAQPCQSLRQEREADLLCHTPPPQGVPISMRRVASRDAPRDGKAPRSVAHLAPRPMPSQTELNEATSAHMEPVITPPLPPQHNADPPAYGAGAERASLAAYRPREGGGSLLPRAPRPLRGSSSRLLTATIKKLACRRTSQA